ncbi:hypothetical protein D9Q98_010032 [Chlorella vulgaris]|uniref:Reverse transcriptase domain-containing protein n=1 Tax=Chlorella vulgaris TaxID=3077 RepID=A0A9D4TG06_CHLVU|nr:hypothetical protein D9Q98_010032 [Chlorella vulgaris]
MISVSNPTTAPPAINPATCHSTPLSTASSELDSDISVADVHAALDKLSSSSACLGPLKAVLIKAGRDALTPVLAALFNAVFRSGCFPPEWSLGAITPIHKKGDTADPNNYRGITVGHILGKLYALAINTRLNTWLETQGLRARGQAGFRQGYRTVDNCFILRALAERARSRGVKLYLCAVDFEKAFDSVDRPLLWAALQRAGIGGTMLQAIQAMYADVPVCVRTEEGLSGCFQSVLGVKQGCPLSPLLFGIFLDDFEGHIQQLGDAAALPQLAGRTVPPLLFADDMFLLSSSASGLQAQLHALQDYCNAKKLTVNAKKTQVMIMRPGGGSGNGKLAAGESFEYAGLPLEVASSTKYLGLTFSQLSKQHGFASCADVLAKAGRQAMFAMRRRAWELGACLVEQQCMLFDVFVKPVLSYGCELWGVDVLLRPDCSSVERVHRWFCRRVQGLPKQVTAAISLAELGRQPLQSFWIQQLVRFWNRLQNSAADEDRVLGWAFKDNLELMREGGDLAAGSACWSRRWLHVLQSAPPASGTLEWLTELDEAAVIERAAAAYLRNSELDSDISVADVHAALDKLSSSSACLGPLKAVLIKAGRDALTPVLAALFNAVFRSGCFPPEWSLGAITPIHKKGDTADPNNYRGITVGHILGKLYALAINTRLNTWLETQGLRARGQAGFRQGYRTVDNCFILRALAERARSRGVKLYLCAVDFEKAFDSVDRPLLWAALQRAGIGGTMLQAIQAMYADVPVCVRTEEGLSGCFQSVLGVKQGCPLSPLLFGIFLDDFEGHIQQLGDAAALPQLAGRTVPPLLFADDMFLLSSSASGLQAQLHALQDYCNAKKLTVNAKKTQVMIMRPGGGSGNGKLAAGESFEYAGLPLEVASSTKYLGLTFSQLSKQHGFASCADVLAKAGRQAMFAMRRRAWELGACLVEQQCMLFDVFVKPVLSYGCELWGVDVLLRPDCSSVERVHRWFCRRVQGLPKQVTAAISLAELGRQPLQSFWIQQLVRFWNRLQNSAADEDRVLGWAFKDNLELMREGGDLAAGSACWSRRWLHVLQSAPPASGTLEWLTELDEAAVIERAAAAYLRNSELDSDISVADVHAALDKLSSSSACLGPLKAVLIKAGRDALTPVLAALFNAVFRSGCFPPEWSLGAITPIHKKGDTADPNNYRGITVGHILGKLYALAINTRLNTWLETQGLRARGQAGFRQGYRTVDNCFILRALAERARSRGVKLYLCAVDFEKAFDSVDRPLLWAALQRAGIGGTMLQAIQAMYADVPVCVRTEEGLSGCFQSVLGVKQGCPLSPLLFGIFLDDFEGHIQQLGDAAALPQLAGRTVPPLLFADDMFLLSSSASGLQAQLHALQDYCNAKKLTVNAKKTQVMIMRPGGGSGNGKLAAGESFEYAGLPLEVASSTKYLGLTFSQLSKQHGFASCADVLAKAGRQAMFAMRRRAWELGACLVEQQCMLFDVFVKPVLSYGCELWGVDVLLRPDCSSVERVHRWFCRRVQGLPKQVTAAISLAELGRQPLQSFWIQQLVRFWNRLQNSAADEDRVLGWAFKDNLELMREGGDLAAGSACWSRRWLHVLQSAPPASGTLEWLTELDEAAVIERAAAAYLRKGVKLYLCAVDFEKAFDSVDRPLLWAALQRAGIGGTMLQAIQAMYADVPVCVRTEEGLSGCFQSVLGVKQGCPLSPLLFGIFLDDFEGHIQQLGDAAALPQLAGRTVPPLLFADDMFLLSSSASGLQAQLHALQDYCNAKKLTVNAKKTQVMIMRPGGGSGNGKLAAGESFEYAGLPLEVASSTKYLGLTFSQLSKQHGFASCADVLAKAGRQAMFAMRRRAWELGACLVEQQCMLFDVFVKPVLSYGCELWGVDVLLRPDCSSVERVHRWFCRRVQGLPKQVTAAISLAELGRQPLQSFWIQQLVRFWNRLQNSAADEDRVLGWAFKDNLELMREGGDLAAGSACWSRRWLHVLQSAPPASGTLEWLTELDEAAVIERAAAAYLRKGVKLYLCAVDFEKAFDSVDRPLLWAALQRAGIGGTMLQAIQAMYADVPVCVRTEEGLSGCFQSVLGVKQGCPLSPLLFGIFLDDFEGHIQQLGDAAALPQLAGRTVPPLLFADDMFLLSSSAFGLQAQLHALQDYCNAKKLTVNAKKTQVMIMRPGGGSGNGKLAAGESFEYAGLPLEVASSTKYLGLTFSQLSKQHGFASCADVLAKAGRQAMFAMRRRAWELGACLVEQQCMLFDVFVKPVLSYGCELWGVDVLLRPDCSSVERVHRWFCRRVQGLPKQVTAAISLAELGRQPLQSFWIQQLVRFWNRLQNSAADEDRVLGWAFKDNLELMREGGDLAAGSACWSRRWLHVLQSAPPASGTLEWLTELDEAAVIERAAAAYLRNSELDSDISVADVHAALDKLSSSSACLGPLKAVLIKAGRDALTPVLAALFNAVFRSGCFPPEWSLGAITPIHKKGDTADPNNYRGITVGHILGKLYALAINTRLNTWLETQGLRARGQAGFRQGYRTVDNCFILRALAERARSRGVKLYLCAVDFEKAFDSVDRPLLWAALQRAGIGGTMLQAIQAMYADVPVCVRTEEGLSGCFQSVLGVKQGCPLSPLLFGIFLDDFEGHIQQLGDAAALPQLAGRTVPPLLFADDMFLLSSSASGLQAQLHALQDYCNAKKLTVNAKKTQVMIMRPGGGSGNGKLAAGESFEYAGLPLEVASSTKYLGLTFSQLSKQHGFASCADVLAKAGRQAMFAMRRLAWELGACLVEQQGMLFDVFVKPVLSYGCELWGVDVLLRPDCSSVERVHRWFCRRVQGLPKQVTAAISLAELGRQPLQSFWIQQLVRFWNRLQNSAADEDRVLGHPRMAH